MRLYTYASDVDDCQCNHEADYDDNGSEGDAGDDYDDHAEYDDDDDLCDVTTPVEV